MNRRNSLLRLAIVIVTIFAIILPNGTIINASSTNTTITYVTSEKGFIKKLYDNLLAKNKKFSIGYKGSWNDVYDQDLDGLFEQVYAIDKEDTSDDYDYMKGNIKKYSLRLSSNGKVCTFTFTVSYRETKNQTAKVNTKIAAVLESLDIADASDYTKVKKIHDYIVNKTTYDSGYTKYTAYQALVKRTAVCQGYALLFYKMATEAGINCRIVTSSSHAWNIVQMGDKWYHVDTTWDDPISEKPVLRYDYFLKGTGSMTKTHTLVAEYRTKAFKKAFPISANDYEQ